jgi:hypothetical protein
VRPPSCRIDVLYLIAVTVQGRTTGHVWHRAHTRRQGPLRPWKLSGGPTAARQPLRRRCSWPGVGKPLVSQQLWARRPDYATSWHLLLPDSCNSYLSTLDPTAATNRWSRSRRLQTPQSRTISS